MMKKHTEKGLRGLLVTFTVCVMSLFSITAMAAPVSITGQVVDANGEPLIGESVLEKGETKQVSFTITPDMLSYFDADAHEWVAEAGEFVLHIASSSANIHSSLPYMYNK